MRMSNFKRKTRILALVLVLVEILSLLGNVAYGTQGAETAAATATSLAEAEPAPTEDQTADGEQTLPAETADPAAEAPAEDAEAESAEAEGAQPEAEEPEEQEDTVRTVSAEITAGGVHYTVDVAYDDAAALPEDVTLLLRELTPEPLTEAAIAAAKEAGRPYETERFVSAAERVSYRVGLTDVLAVDPSDMLLSTAYLDMALLGPDGPVEPAAPVEVTVTTDLVEQALSDTVELAMLTQREIVDDEGETRLLTEGEALRPENLTRAPVIADGAETAGEEAPVTLRFTAESLSTLGLASLAGVADTRQVSGVDVTLYAPRGFDVERTDVPAMGVTPEHDVLLSFLTELTEKSDGADAEAPAVPAAERGFAPALWLTAEITGQTPKNWGEGGLVGYRDDAEGRVTLFDHAQTTAPVRICAGDVVTVLWDTGLRSATVRSGDVRVSGLLPADAVLEARNVTGAYADAAALIGDDEGYARTMAAYDLSITADGETYAPDETRPVTVTLSLDGVAPGKAITVWHVTGGAAAAVEDCVLADGSLTFTAAEPGVYVVVNSGRETTVTAGDGKTYEITVTYPYEAAIPREAELTTRELTGREYAICYSRTQGKLGMNGFSAMRAFDIAFLLPDGTEAEPQAPVQVSIRMLNSAMDHTRVVHFGSSGTQVITPDMSDDGTTADFTADSFSVYAVVQVTKEQILEASDGNTYKVTVTYDNYSGIPTEAELAVTELAESSPAYAEYVQKAAETLGKETKHFAFAHAFDITLIDPVTGEHYQPTKDVKVSIDLLTEDVQQGDDVSVVHFSGTYTENPSEEGKKGAIVNGEAAEVIQANVVDGAVEFESSGFSVYVIISSEGGEIITPRVEFHFLDETFVDHGDGTYTASPYEFINSADDHAAVNEDPTNVQTTQILKSGEALENVPNPPNLVTYDNDGTTVLSSKYFFGWYIVKGATVADDGDVTYTWDADPEQVFLEIPMTINDSDIVWANDSHTAITSLTWSMNGKSHTASVSENNTDNNHIVLDEYGVIHVYLAPIYEDYYFVNFHLGAKETAKDEYNNWDRTGLWSNLLTRRLIVLGSDGKAEVHLDLTAPATDVKRQVFYGWETVTVSPRTETVEGEDLQINYPLDRRNFYPTVDPATGVEQSHPDGKDGYYITVKRDDTITLSADETMGASKSVDLYPVFAEARWVYFDIGKSGNGATYVGAKYLLTSDGITDSTYCLNHLPGINAYTHTETVEGSETPVTVVDDAAVRRNGFEFGGWYYGAVRDADGNIANLTGPYSTQVKDIDPDTGEELTTSHPVTYAQAVQITDDSGAFITHDASYSYTYKVNSNGTETTLFTVSGNEYKDANGELLFKIVGGKLYIYKALDELNLYANWVEIRDTTIQVNVWRQKVSDDKNASDDEKTYDYFREYSYKAHAQSGWTLAEVRSNGLLTVPGTAADVGEPYYDNRGKNVEAIRDQGFHLRTTTMSAARVAGDGSTVVNVYYDRDLRAINFYYYTYNMSITAPAGAVDAYQYSTTSNTGPQCGLINDRYVELNYTNGKWMRPEYAYVYTQDPNGAYGKVGEKYYLLTPVMEDTYSYTTENTYSPTTSNSGTQYGIVDGEYVQLISPYAVYCTTDGRGKGKDGQDNVEYYGLVNNSYQRVYYANDKWRTGPNKNSPIYSNGTVYCIESYYYGGTYTEYTGTTNGGYYVLVKGIYEYRILTYKGAVSSSIYDWYDELSIGYNTVYTLSGNRPYTGTRYTQSAGATYTGNRLTRSGNSAPYTYTVTTGDGTDLYRQDDNQGPDGSYGHIKLNATVTSTQTGAYTYVDDNGVTQNYPADGNRYSRSYTPTGNQVEYKATIFTRSISNIARYRMVTWSGLYGQSLAQNGYSWDDVSGYRWYERKTGSNKEQTFLDAFIQSDNPYNLWTDESASTTSVIYYYRQQLDGTYTLDDRETVYVRGGSLQFTDKFDGFKVSTYSTSFSPSGGTYEATSSSSLRPLHVYHKRNRYSITFVTQYPGYVDLWEEGGTPSDNGKTVSDILYGASLSSYGSGGSNYWQPNVPPHYIFKGWFADPGWLYDEKTSVPYDFDSTMPSGDVIVYGKWIPEEFLVRIDPNGGVIDHINHWGANEFELTASYSGKYEGSRWGVYSFNTFRPNAAAATDLQKYNTSQATFFWNYYNQPISEYATVVRDYVEITPTEANAMRTAYANATTDAERTANTVYYYLNTQYNDPTEQLKIPADARNALYLAEDEVATYFTFFREISLARYSSCPYGEDDIEGWKRDFFAQDDDGNYRLYRHRNNKEYFTMLGWYQVYYDDQGNETGIASTPYNFADPTKGKVTLRALWRLDGGYYILYTPEQTVNGKVINGDMDAWTDPLIAGGTYTDGAKTNIYRQPNNITEDGDLEQGKLYDFVGWRLVSPKTGAGGTTIYVPLEGHAVYQPGDVVYQPGDEWYVKASYADASSIIHMQAVYQLKSESVRRPEVVNLTLDANSGYLVQADGTELADDANLTWDGPGIVTMNAAADTIDFGDVQSNTAVHLYQYATPLTKDSQEKTLSPAGVNYFKHNENFLLIGFDNEYRDDGVTIDKGTDYVATYPADSVISLTGADRQTLYAVWEPMVYLNFVNNTNKTLTFSLSSTEGALTIINAKNGLYGRSPVPAADLNALSIEPNETLMYAVPEGAEKQITVSIKNELGIGKALTWDTSLTVGETEYNTAVGADPINYTHATGDTHVLAKGKVNNTLTGSFTEKLLVNPDGLTVTFDDSENDYALVLDSNFQDGGYQEFDYSLTQITAQNASQRLPSTSTRPGGYQFLGWAYRPAATVADFSATMPGSSPWTIANLYDFFNNDTSVQKETIVTTEGGETHTLVIARLYAVWKINKDASKVYIFKDVPEPGRQDIPFEFTLRLSGKYTWKDGNNTPQESVLNQDFTFKLYHGDFAVLESSNSTTQGFIQTEVTIYKSDSTIRTPKETHRVQAPDGTYGDSGSFNSTERITVTETAKANYTTTVTRTAQTDTNYLYIGSSPDTSTIPLTKETNVVHWNNTFAGGTISFTNTRQTADVTVKKVLVGASARAFSFSASYTADGRTVPLDDFTVSSSSADGVKLEKIPVGGALTITEKGPDLLDYNTTVKLGDTDLTVTKPPSTTNSGVTTYYRAVTKTITDNSTVTFRNVLKSFPVKIVLRGYDGTTYTKPNADFTLKKGATSTVFTARRVNSSNSVVYNTGTPFSTGAEPDGKLYIGSYTLKEIWLEESYLALTDEFDFIVTKDGVSLVGSPAGVELTTEGSGEETKYVITVTNRKTVPVTIAKTLVDPLISTTLDFEFNVTYYLDGNGNAFTSTVKVTSSDSNQVRIPINSKLVVSENVDAQVSEQPISSRYDTTYRIGSANPVNGSSLTIEKLTEATRLTFTNTFKSSNITVKKTVEKDDDTNSFTFTVTLLVGANPVKQYTVFDNDTLDNYGDDLRTDNNGQVTFDLQKDGTKTLSIPIGAKLEIAETAAKDTNGVNVLSTYTTTVKTTDQNGNVYNDNGTFVQTERKYTLPSVPATNLVITFKNGFGVDVYFKKIDGFGNGVGNAEFKLFETYDAALNNKNEKVVSITVNDREAFSVESAATPNDNNKIKVGDVRFKAPVGTWYLRETGNPDSTKYVNNDNIYQIVIEDADHVTIKLYNGIATEDAPDIAKYGIMNTSTAERKAILRKVSDTYTPLAGAVFEILRYDHTLVSSTDINGATTTSFTSGASGVYFIDMLPFGTYYLHETTIPSGYQEVTAGDDGNWFILTVNENGVGYEQATDTGTAIRNTLSPVVTKPN